MTERMVLLCLALSAVVLAVANGKATPKFNAPDANEADFKWTAWIEKDNAYRCGASLIDENWVLTAASCVYDYVQAPDNQFFRVYLGDYNIAVEDDQQQIRSCNILVNKKYNATSNEHNIAMMQLERPANLDRSNIAVVPEVSKSNINIKTLKQADCYATGYGYNGTGGGLPLNQIRKALPVNFRNPSRCAGLPGFDENQHLCYSTDQGAPCDGDAGSPITCNLDNVWTQVGVQLTENCDVGFQYGTWTYKNRRFITESLTKISDEPCKEPEPDLGCGPAGKSFMISYVTPDPTGSRPMLYITSTVDTKVYLQPGADVVNLFLRLDYPIAADNGLVIPLPTQLSVHQTGVSTVSLRVYSSDDLSVVAGYEPDAIGTTQIFPEECLKNFSYSYLPIGYAGGFGGLSELLIVALENNTQVQISAPISTQVTLNQLQVYRRDVDPTGLRVTGTGPLAVFSGIACGNIKDEGTSYCDTMYEQIQPESTLQSAYIVPALKPRNNTYLRVLAAADATNVSVTQVAGLETTNIYQINQQQYQDTENFEVDALVVLADAPVIVGQYGYGGTLDLLNVGDPSFLITPAIAEFTTFYSLYAPATSGYIWAAITISESADTSGLRLNGAPVTGSSGNVTVNVSGLGSYKIFYEELCYGMHRIKHVDGETKFGVVQYNMQYYRETAHAPRRLYSS